MTRERVSGLARAALKGVILALALVLLLLPSNRLWGPAYWFLFGLPILVAAFRTKSDEAFFAWACYALSFVIFIGIRAAADDLGMPLQYEYVIALDRLVGFGTIPTIRLQQAGYTPGRWDPISVLAVGVHLTYYVAPPLAGILLWRLAPRRFLRYAAALSICYLLGAAVHILLPTAPPWYAALDGRLPAVHRIVYDLVNGMSPSFYSYGYKVAGGNEVAAMPSLHYAAAHLIAMGLWPWRVGRIAGGAYAVAMAFSLTYLGEHYIVDAIAGALIASLAWWVARRLESTSSNPEV